MAMVRSWTVACRRYLWRRLAVYSMYNDGHGTQQRGSVLTQWFVQQGAQREDLGPYRPVELLDLVRNGEVTKETMLRKDDSSWFLAGVVGGLFEAALRPTIQYFCPQCELEVSEPPVICQRCGREIRQGITRITEHSIVQRTDPPVNGSAGGSVKRWLLKKGIGKSQQKHPDI